jgi:hypothetical protein
MGRRDLGRRPCACPRWGSASALGGAPQGLAFSRNDAMHPEDRVRTRAPRDSVEVAASSHDCHGRGCVSARSWREPMHLYAMEMARRPLGAPAWFGVFAQRCHAPREPPCQPRRARQGRMAGTAPDHGCDGVVVARLASAHSCKEPMHLSGRRDGRRRWPACAGHDGMGRGQVAGTRASQHSTMPTRGHRVARRFLGRSRCTCTRWAPRPWVAGCGPTISRNKAMHPENRLPTRVVRGGWSACGPAMMEGVPRVGVVSARSCIELMDRESGAPWRFRPGADGWHGGRP